MSSDEVVVRAGERLSAFSGDSVSVFTEDLEAAREELHRQGYIPQVKRSHKADLARLTLNLGKAEKMVLRGTPEHAEEVASFLNHFGLEYRGATLCTAIAAVLEKLLRPKRATFTDTQRDAVYVAKGHRCAICDAELRVGEDHGDH